MATRYLDWNRLYHTEVASYFRRKVDLYESAFPKAVHERYTAPRSTGGKLSGDLVVENIRNCLRNGMGIQRSETQWKVHEACIQAMIPMIYGEEWDLNQGRILKKFGLKEVKQEVLIIMSRRQGKSYSVAMYVAACLLNIPGVRIAVWATAYRLSRALMEIVKNMLEKAFTHSYNEKEYIRGESNSERCSYFGPDGSERILLCLPGTAKV